MHVTFFGHSDAINEKEALQQYFYKQPLLDELKLAGKTEGVFIIVGSKGSGKTALSQAIQNECEDEVVWSLGRTDGFHPNEQMLTKAPVTQHLLTNILATGVVERIRKARKNQFSAAALNKLKKLEEGPLQKIARFLTVTGKVSLSPNSPGIEFDFSKLKKSKDLDVFQRISLDGYVEAMRPALKEHKAYVLIDDVDEIFPDGELYDGFLEGIVRACVQLNIAFRGDLHCILFLNSGMYEKYFKSARTYDKSREFFGKIRWDSDELAEMLAMRIRYQLNVTKKEPAWTSWKRAFDVNTEKDVMKVQTYMIERCNSGPRDLITFGNLAKDRSGTAQISLAHVKEAEGEYSREKLFLLNREYGPMYNRLAELLDAVFAGQRVSYEAGKLEGHIRTKLFGSGNIRKTYGQLDYLKYGSPKEFLELLYRTGFIGYKANKGAEFTFSMAVPDPGDHLYTAITHRIHPAYHSYLRLTE